MTTCPKCSREIKTEYDLCPHCGSLLSLSYDDDMEYCCSLCKEGISAIVYEYSLEHFGKPLCMEHQELEKQKLSCQNCRQLVTKTVYNYSIGRYKKPLCIHCQAILDEIPRKGDDTYDDKGFYCNQCGKTISFPMYRFAMRNYHKPLCKDCQEEQ